MTPEPEKAQEKAKDQMLGVVQTLKCTFWALREPKLLPGGENSTASRCCWCMLPVPVAGSSSSPSC